MRRRVAVHPMGDHEDRVVGKISRSVLPQQAKRLVIRSRRVELVEERELLAYAPVH